MVGWLVALEGCKQVQGATRAAVIGEVTDDRGQPVAGATVRLFDLIDHPSFVEGGDLGAARAYIDREAVLQSSDDQASGETGDDGEFSFDTTPGAFLAVATRAGCTAGFAGFDEQTGVLSVDTLIEPKLQGGLSFEVPRFVLACATPPDEVGPQGNASDAPSYDPPAPDVACDADACAAAGGACEGDTCAISCVPDACAATGGACDAGRCVPPACDADACAAAGGTCSGDACLAPACDPIACGAVGGTCTDPDTCAIPACLGAEADCTAAGGACSADGEVCELPACRSDDDCAAGQPGAYCTDPGVVGVAACHPPDPGEIVPPPDPLGWISFQLTDPGGSVLADASGGNQVLDPPADGLVRVRGMYDGPADTAYLQVQSGSQSCPGSTPRTDTIAVELDGGALSTASGDGLDLALTGGYQKLQLTTAPALGQGEQSYVIEVGSDVCAPPADPMTVTLTWDAGPGAPADLDLSVWDAAGELVYLGDKDAAWGQMELEGEGPGPEVFVATDPSQGPFTVKVTFFSGKPRDVEGKVRITRTVGGQLLDETFVVTVSRPKDVADVGVFEAE